MNKWLFVYYTSPLKIGNQVISGSKSDAYKKFKELHPESLVLNIIEF